MRGRLSRASEGEVAESASGRGRRSKTNDELRSILRSSGCEVTKLKPVATAMIVPRDETPRDQPPRDQPVGGDSEGTLGHNLVHVSVEVAWDSRAHKS